MVVKRSRTFRTPLLDFNWSILQRNQDSAALFRPDPFGVNDYFVEYSLNKKKRWTMKEEIKDRIEEVQVRQLFVHLREFCPGCFCIVFSLPETDVIDNLSYFSRK